MIRRPYLIPCLLFAWSMPAAAKSPGCAAGLTALRDRPVTSRQMNCASDRPEAANAFAVLCTPDGGDVSPAVDRYRTFESAYAAAVEALMAASNAAETRVRARALATLEIDWETTGNRDVVDRALDALHALARACEVP